MSLFQKSHGEEQDTYNTHLKNPSKFHNLTHFYHFNIRILFIHYDGIIDLEFDQDSNQ